MKVDTEPGVEPRDHVVLFYDSAERLVTTVARFVADGLSAGETSVIVATAPHIVAFEDAMAASGVDLSAARADGSLLIIDAAQAMARFLVDDWPETGRFDSEFGGLIRAISESGRPVRVYGEMVALLWDAGHVAAAIELEALWNDLAQHVSFTLLCAYPAASMSGDEVSFQHLCHCHSAVLDTHASSTRTRASRSFLGNASSLRGTRQFVMDTLHSWDLDHVGEDAAIVVSELATNAVLHARSDFVVALALDGDTVRISVSDASSHLPVVQEPSPTTISGRGLVLVSALGARWGTQPVGDGKEVWVELSA